MTTLQADSLAALAFLLGHKWTGDFSRGFADLEVGRTLKSLQDNRKKLIEIETEADYFGSLYSYIVGYGVADVVGPILGKIYADYGLDENLEGYPSLDERQIIAQRSQENLRRTIPIFEAGNRLLLIRRYEEAAHCFEFSARGLRIGHPLPQLNAAYGPPDHLIASRRGTFHVYTESRIIFHTDAHDKLCSWLIYCIE
jgi:hypothetical protein